MKKLSIDKLSQKQVAKFKHKVAFSQFVQSLKLSPENCWLCCDSTFVSLKDLHKHISCNHKDIVENYFEKLHDNLSSTCQSKPTCDNVHTVVADNKKSTIIPVTNDEHNCSCCPKNFIVLLFYHYVYIGCSLNFLKTWQVYSDNSFQ